MRNVWRVFAARPWHAHMKSKLAVAAVLLAALTIGIYWVSQSPQRAYALEDLPSRLLEIKSIYLTGWQFPPSALAEHNGHAPAKYPMKFFAERPGCYWHTRYGFSSGGGPDGTVKHARVSSGYAAGKAGRTLLVFHDGKKAIESSVSAIENELATEWLIQAQLPLKLSKSNLSGFVKKSEETLKNVRCDVYERSFDQPQGKKRVWFDPRTGLPVQIASYEVDRAGQEELQWIIDHVEVNIPASATGLSFDPPKGYHVTRTAAPTLRAIQSGSGSSSGGAPVSLGVWNAFNIDDKAALLCWYCESRTGTKGDRIDIQADFVLGGAAIPCDHKDIAFADVGDHHWIWSLVWPKQAGEPIGDGGVAVVHRHERGQQSMGCFPLRFREERLKAILQEIQRITKTTVPGSSEPFTLDTLRTQIQNRR